MDGIKYFQEHLDEKEFDLLLKACGVFIQHKLKTSASVEGWKEIEPLVTKLAEQLSQWCAEGKITHEEGGPALAYMLQQIEMEMLSKKC